LHFVHWVRKREL